MDKLQQTLNEIDIELQKLSKEMKDTQNLFESKAESRLSFLKWVNNNWKLRNNKPPDVVKQREIFYCQLGENIGSEQNGNRPVVIIQNDIGNSKGKTTIVVPITTYENSDFYIKDSQIYMSYYNPNGKKIERKLDFYEIKIELEDGFKHNIYGVANVAHIREVSKKRLKQTPVARVTNETYNQIIDAVMKNLRQI